jgi:CRP-like cAMP-binding protein
VAKNVGDLTRTKDRAARAMVKGDWDDALEYLQKANQLAPKDTFVLRKMGDMYQRIGDKEKAVESYKQAAVLFAASGFLFKAISVNKLILSIDPDATDVQENLAVLYANKQKEIGIDSDKKPTVKKQKKVVTTYNSPELLSLGDMIPIDQLDSLNKKRPKPKKETPSKSGNEIALDIELEKVDRDKLPWTPLFSDLNESEMHRVIDKLVPVFAAAGTVICREDEDASSLYIVAHGLVKISSRDSKGNPLWLTNLSEGEFFGEFGFFSDGKRHADVLAVEDTDLLQIGRKEIEDIEKEFPRVKEVLFSFYKQRVVDSLFAKSPIFKSLVPGQRMSLIDQASLEVHSQGSMIIQEGDDGEGLFLIKSGEVEVSTRMQEKKICLATLQAGEFFGEISVLTGLPTMADVIAKNNCELVKFSKREILAIAEEHPQVAHLLAEVKEHRIHKTVQQIQLEGFV